MMSEDKDIQLFCEDFIKGMGRIADGSVNCIITDPPYGTTCNKWDKTIPFDKLWEQFDRIITPNGVIVIFATQPFTTRLISSNMKMWRYNWIWQKDSPNGFLNANYAPLKITEDICVFSKGKVVSLSKNAIVYNPQGVVEVNKVKRNNPNNGYRASQGYTVGGNALNNGKSYTQEYENYPTNILKFSRDEDAFHPTQKPLALLRYLIRTYTFRGDLVLDCCSGSGTTMVAASMEGRRFVGFETDRDFYDKSVKRLRESRLQSEIAFDE